MPGPGTRGGHVREIDRHRFPPEILRDGAVEVEVDALSTLPIANLCTRFAKHVGRCNGHRAQGWRPRRSVVTNPDPEVGGSSNDARRLMSANSS